MPRILPPAPVARAPDPHPGLRPPLLGRPPGPRPGVQVLRPPPMGQPPDAPAPEHGPRSARVPGAFAVPCAREAAGQAPGVVTSPEVTRD